MIWPLRKLISAVRAGFAWDRARQLSSQGQHEAALAEIEEQPPWITSSIQWKMLGLQQHYVLGHTNEALQVAKELRLELVASKRLSVTEIAYALGYVEWLVSNIEFGGPSRVNEKELARIDLARVPSSWKANFPLRGHPEWREERL